MIVGCGAQGLNQGLNMRDSGLDISYALRDGAIKEKGGLEVLISIEKCAYSIDLTGFLSSLDQFLKSLLRMHPLVRRPIHRWNQQEAQDPADPSKMGSQTTPKTVSDTVIESHFLQKGQSLGYRSMPPTHSIQIVTGKIRNPLEGLRHLQRRSHGLGGDQIGLPLESTGQPTKEEETEKHTKSK